MPGIVRSSRIFRRSSYNIFVLRTLDRFHAVTVGSGQKRYAANHTESDSNWVSIIDHLDDIRKIPLADVRNFCIIAHVDHGKSSLASRILEYTGNLGRERQSTAHQRGRAEIDMHSLGESDVTLNSQETTLQTSKDTKEEITLLDTLKVERERGITVKASAASMLYCHPSATNKDGWILLNMVDTPGHADFGMEVSKSLDSVEGAVLLFDAVQGEFRTVNDCHTLCFICVDRDCRILCRFKVYKHKH